MNVSELIFMLSKLDPRALVLGACDDMAGSKPIGEPKFFLVESVGSIQAVLSRDDDRNPLVTMDSGPGSRIVAVIDLVTRY